MRCETKLVCATGTSVRCTEKVRLRVRSPVWNSSRPGPDFEGLVFFVMEMANTEVVFGWDKVKTSPMILGSLLDCVCAQGGLVIQHPTLPPVAPGPFDSSAPVAAQEEPPLKRMKKGDYSLQPGEETYLYNDWRTDVEICDRMRAPEKRLLGLRRTTTVYLRRLTISAWRPALSPRQREVTMSACRVCQGSPFMMQCLQKSLW